jgi:Kef-type K+ transport system membrane component KefB
MLAQGPNQAFFILLLGTLLFTTLALRELGRRAHFPPIIGYLLLGLVLRWQNDGRDFLNHEGIWLLEVLGEIGVVCLLFKVGLESNFQGLLRQLPNAVWIWIGNVGLSATLGFVTSRHLLGYPLVPSLFAATALSATSIGVALTVWQDCGRLRTELGEVVTDAAELDDLSTVFLLVLLFAMTPILHAGGSLEEMEREALLALGALVLKGLFFTAACFIFAHFMERPLTRMFRQGAEPVLLLVACGLIVSALAGWLGFSVAIGGLFGGLIFSRDPVAVKENTHFEPIHELFKPFFFIAIGYQIEPSILTSALGPGVALVAAALIGKLCGAGLPAWRRHGINGAILIGASMVPRAEIAMVVARSGHHAGAENVSSELYAALVLVCLVTSLLTPPILERRLRRLPMVDSPPPG